MQVIQYDRASQRLRCPHRETSVPTAAVYIQILDAGGNEVLASTAATKGSLSTTLSALAALGAKSITLTAVTGLSVGDRIVLTDTHGRSEVCVVVGLASSAKTVALQDRLSRAYASSDTVKAADIYYSLDASAETTWPKGFYSAIWECTEWSRPRITMFRIADLGAPNPITFDHVRRWCSYLDTLRDGHDDAGLTVERDAAWRMIKAKVRAAGRDPETLRELEDGGDSAVESIADAGGLLAAAMFLSSHGHSEYAKTLAGEIPGEGGMFASYWGDIVSTPTWFDEDQDRGVDGLEMREAASSTLRRGL